MARVRYVFFAVVTLGYFISYACCFFIFKLTQNKYRKIFLVFFFKLFVQFFFNM